MKRITPFEVLLRVGRLMRRGLDALERRESGELVLLAAGVDVDRLRATRADQADVVARSLASRKRTQKRGCG